MGNEYEVTKATSPGKGAAADAGVETAGKRTLVEQELGPMAAGPGLTAVQARLRGPDPNARDLARVLDQYPEERAAIVDAIRRMQGDALAEATLEAERALRKEQGRPHLGLSGLRLGDTVLRPTLPFGTDDRYDSAQNKAAAEQRVDNQRAADRAGDKNPDPIGDALRGKKPLTAEERKALGTVDAAIDSARRQLAKPDAGTSLEVRKRRDE